MEGVDAIITQTLKTVGCNFGCGIDKFNAEMVVNAVAKCINLIDPSIQVCQSLPPNMAARYRIGSTLAEAVKVLGYQGEVGYHTFLYSNVPDMRQLFLFLINKLPKQQLNVQKEFFSPQDSLKRLIRNKITESQDKPWVPLMFMQNFVQHINFEAKKPLNPGCRKFVPDDKRVKYLSHHLPILCSQLCIDKYLYPSLVENNCLQMAVEQNKMKFFTNKDHILDQNEIFADLQNAINQASTFERMCGPISPSSILLEAVESSIGVDSSHLYELSFGDCDIKNRNFVEEMENENLEELQARASSLLIGIGNAENEVIQTKDLIEEVVRKGSAQLAENTKRSEILKNKVKILELTPCVNENLKKLEEAAQKSKEHLELQLEQWKEYQQTLCDKFHQLSHRAERDEIESRHFIEEVQDVKIKIKELASYTCEKKVIHKQLVKDYESMISGLKRNDYTQRILEIVFSINKQNHEIEKVILDTKSIQKEINTLSGVAERTFIDADELIFKIAKRDEYARKIYKLLASLHENCNSLVKLVERTGTMLKEVSDLEEQIEKETGTKISESLENILRDYNQIKQENQGLLQDIKIKSSH